MEERICSEIYTDLNMRRPAARDPGVNKGSTTNGRTEDCLAILRPMNIGNSSIQGDSENPQHGRLHQSDISVYKDVEIPVLHDPILLSDYGHLQCSVSTDIGNRRKQEDRFTICPVLLPGYPISFFGVFDGTVGDFASNSVKDLIVPNLLHSKSWSEFVLYLQDRDRASGSSSSPLPSPGSLDPDRIIYLLKNAMKDMYVNSDLQLIHMARDARENYASSTSVTAIIAGEYLCIGHLGDSRIAIGIDEQLTGIQEHYGETHNFEEVDHCDENVYLHTSMPQAYFLTTDHKPDQPHEKSRILSNGGSVEYLQHHNCKPFIRGGDFLYRKALGDQPMQLQYSRAFGGKDLKAYGLSSDPDITVVKLDPSHTCLILASDGIWDVYTARQAIVIATDAKRQGIDPARALIQETLRCQRSWCQNADNLTVIVIFFKHPLRPLV